MTNDNTLLDARRIMELLPHRYPFLLIDRIIACQPGQSITALKNVTINEAVFQGHFPGQPILPGVLIIEAMAQAGGVLSHVTLGEVDPKPLFVLAAVNNARFKRMVLPGDQLLVQVDVEKVKRGMWFYKGSASVDGALAVSADITCAPGAQE